MSEGQHQTGKVCTAQRGGLPGTARRAGEEEASVCCPNYRRGPGPLQGQSCEVDPRSPGAQSGEPLQRPSVSPSWGPLQGTRLRPSPCPQLCLQGIANEDLSLLQKTVMEMLRGSRLWLRDLVKLPQFTHDALKTGGFHGR